MIPTPEQQAVIEAARSTPNNLLVTALAGAAKTTTLVMTAEASPKVGMLCLAFNRRIADEMRDRLPGNCVAMTLNGLGHRVWGAAIGRSPIVETKKNYNILSALISDLSKAKRDEAWDHFPDILKAIDLGKARGYLPTGRYKQARPIMGDDAFFASLDEEPSQLFVQLVREATLVSVRQAQEGLIDFSDQIILPTIFPTSFPQYPCVLVDEAQDLSALNHATLRKLARNRLIAVGDECQSIYAFRGAHQDSMAKLQSEFDMTELPLTTSFRCPQSVVHEARWRAPRMRWADGAPLGRVESLAAWGPDSLPDRATILCRNNAPLFSIAIALLRNGRFAQIVGNDIGKGLIRILKKLGPPNLRRTDVMDAIEGWRRDKLAKSRDESKTNDQADCLQVFALEGENLDGAIAYAEHTLAARGPITLTTIHKAKGLEWPSVFLLDRQLIRMDEPQDRNLLYVAQTRTQDTLTYVTSDGWAA